MQTKWVLAFEHQKRPQLTHNAGDKVAVVACTSQCKLVVRMHMMMHDTQTVEWVDVDPIRSDRGDNSATHAQTQGEWVKR